LRERREQESAHEKDGQREREKTDEQGVRPGARPWDMTRAKGRRQTLNRLSHPGAPCSVLKIYLFILKRERKRMHACEQKQGEGHSERISGRFPAERRA